MREASLAALPSSSLLVFDPDSQIITFKMTSFRKLFEKLPHSLRIGLIERDARFIEGPLII